MAFLCTCDKQPRQFLHARSMSFRFPLSPFSDGARLSRAMSCSVLQTQSSSLSSKGWRSLEDRSRQYNSGGIEAEGLDQAVELARTTTLTLPQATALVKQADQIAIATGRQQHRHEILRMLVAMDPEAVGKSVREFASSVVSHIRALVEAYSDSISRAKYELCCDEERNLRRLRSLSGPLAHSRSHCPDGYDKRGLVNQRGSLQRRNAERSLRRGLASACRRGPRSSC